MSPTFLKNRTTQIEHIPTKSQFSRIKTPLRKKSRIQIGMERLGHESDETLPSASIEEGIMKYGYFLFHIGELTDFGEFCNLAYILKS